MVVWLIVEKPGQNLQDGNICGRSVRPKTKGLRMTDLLVLEAQNQPQQRHPLLQVVLLGGGHYSIDPKGDMLIGSALYHIRCWHRIWYKILQYDYCAEDYSGGAAGASGKGAAS